MSEQISFITGTAEYLEGETLTQGGVTATIRRVVVSGGTWSGGTATGYLVIDGRAGGDYAAGVATSASGSASLVAVQTAITIPDGGKYRFTNHNFGGIGYGERMYGVNGVGRPFEFDGTTYVPIISGAIAPSVDKPTHVAAFAEHLFLVYPGGAVLHSELGNPREFSVIEDAGEHNVGSDVTNVIENAQTSLVFFGKSKITYLVGSDNDTFQHQTITDTAGAVEGSAVMMMRPWYIDDGGIRDLAASDALGDWRMGSTSEMIAPYFEIKTRQGVDVACAMRCRAKSQYRVYFDDGTGLVGYIGRKAPEFLPFELPFTAFCCVSGEDADGREVLFVGGDDGMVYQMDVGPSFDGAEVLAWLRLHFVAPNGTHIDYQWSKAELELDGSAQNTIYVSAEFDYGSPNSAPGIEEAFTVTGGGGFYDASHWDTVYYDAPVQSQAEAYLDGYGANCSLAVISQSTYEEPYTLSSVRFLTSQRRAKR